MRSSFNVTTQRICEALPHPKARAVIARFLIEREKSLLDELVTMHHGYLTLLRHGYRSRASGGKLDHFDRL